MGRSLDVFVHVPKTAGSTLLDLLSRQYGPPNVHRTRAMDLEASLEDFRGISQAERDKVRLLMGHGVLRLQDLFPPGTRMFTFLRDPFEQFISSFHYIRRATWNRYHEQVKDMRSELQFLEHRVITGNDNPQTRHLAGLGTDPLPDPDGELRVQVVDEAVSGRASTQLDAMVFVGLTEHFDESLLLLSDVLGWKGPLRYQVHNRTRSRPKVPADHQLRSAFEEVYAADLELYERARSRLQKQLADAGAGFAVRTASFRAWNRVAQEYGRLQHFLTR
ncbi:MAG: sulfotransferase family 2 domain-containing protein [Flavobacteriales bacterium]|nr:sulfotransferase family 2 domain-containing protein [Flavobacteriales bacterium]